MSIKETIRDKIFNSILEASPMVKPPVNRFDSLDDAKKHRNAHFPNKKILKSTYTNPTTGAQSSHYKIKTEEAEHMEEQTPTKKQVKQAIGIARDKRYAGGNMTNAVKTMNKINKGLARHPAVDKELQKQNEETDYAEKHEMAQTQLHFIKYAAEEILEYIEMGGKIEEWYQNKLSKSHSDMESLHSYIEGEMRRTGMKEEAEQVEEGDQSKLNIRDRRTDGVSYSKGNEPKGNVLRGLDNETDKLKLKQRIKSGHGLQTLQAMMRKEELKQTLDEISSGLVQRAANKAQKKAQKWSAPYGQAGRYDGAIAGSAKIAKAYRDQSKRLNRAAEKRKKEQTDITETRVGWMLKHDVPGGAVLAAKLKKAKEPYKKMKELAKYSDSDKWITTPKDKNIRKEDVAKAPVYGDRWEKHAVLHNTTTKRRAIIKRKDKANYPKSDGWKEISPGKKMQENEV